MKPHCSLCFSNSHWADECPNYASSSIFTCVTWNPLAANAYYAAVLEEERKRELKRRIDVLVAVANYADYLASLSPPPSASYPYEIFYAGSVDPITKGVAPDEADQRCVCNGKDHRDALMQRISPWNHGEGARFIVIGHSAVLEKIDHVSDKRTAVIFEINKTSLSNCDFVSTHRYATPYKVTQVYR